MMAVRRIRLAAAIFWTFTIMALCWLSPRWVHEVERGSSWLVLPNLDKVAHWGLFLVFAVLWLRTSASTRRYWLVALGGVALAAITELVQNLPIVNRDGNVGDALSDIIGVLIGLAIAAWVEPILRLVESRLFGKTVS
jgi:uncharacterized membrane protein YccC